MVAPTPFQMTMLFAVLVSTAAAGSESTATWHSPKATIILSSAITGAPLLSSSKSVWRHTFGRRVSNVSAVVVQPADDQLCQNPSADWRGTIILAGDWTSPGCSVETRARAFQSVGAIAAVFEGTEGLPFPWDGSDRGGLSLPTFVISPGVYKQLVDARAMAVADSPVPEASAHLWLKPTDTPLLGSLPFIIFDRTLQALFFLAALSNMAFASVRLRGFWSARLSQYHSVPILVLSLEMASSACMLIFLVDGPGIEHTRPSVMPFMVWRLMQSFNLELTMISFLIISVHLRKIRKRVEPKVEPKADPIEKAGAGLKMWGSPCSCANAIAPHEGSRAATESGLPSPCKQTGIMGKVLSQGSTFRRGSSLNTDNTRRRSSVIDFMFDLMAPGGCTFTFYDNVFAAMVVLFIIVENASAVLTSLYLATFELSFIAVVYIAGVHLVMGVYFIRQASVITRYLHAAHSARGQGGNQKVGMHKNHVQRFIVASRRIGICIIFKLLFFITYGIASEYLYDDAGWAYWWTVLPIGAIVISAQIASTSLAISAFRVPDKLGMARKRPFKNSFLRTSHHATIDVTNATVEVQRASDMPEGDASPSVA